jgi:hypothetical protein
MGHASAPIRSIVEGRLCQHIAGGDELITAGPQNKIDLTADGHVMRGRQTGTSRVKDYSHE